MADMSKGGQGTDLRQAIGKTIPKKYDKFLENLMKPPHEGGPTDKETQDFLIENDMTLQQLIEEYGPKEGEGDYRKKQAKGGKVKKNYANGGTIRKPRRAK